jgi:hypothetical protein
MLWLGEKDPCRQTLSHIISDARCLVFLNFIMNFSLAFWSTPLNNMRNKINLEIYYASILSIISARTHRAITTHRASSLTQERDRDGRRLSVKTFLTPPIIIPPLFGPIFPHHHHHHHHHHRTEKWFSFTHSESNPKSNLRTKHERIRSNAIWPLLPLLLLASHRCAFIRYV